MTFIQNPVLQQNIQYLKGVGEHRAALYGRLGIVTVEDLLRHYPRGYIDFSNITPLLQAQPGQVCCIKAQITKKRCV